MCTRIGISLTKSAFTRDCPIEECTVIMHNVYRARRLQIAIKYRKGKNVHML